MPTPTDQRSSDARTEPITRVVIEEQILAPGSLLHEQDGGALRITFDPPPTTAAVVRAFASVIYGRDILALFASSTTTETPAPAVRVRSVRLDDGTPAALRDTTRIFDLAIDFTHPPTDVATALQALIEEAIETRRWTRRRPFGDGTAVVVPEMHTPIPANATAEQAAGMAEIDRIINESGDPAGAASQFLDLIQQEKAQAAGYVPPTDFDAAEALTCAGGRGAILKAYLLTPMWEGAPDGPMRLSVFTEPGSEGELDAAGATKLIADLETLLPKLRVMRGVLAAQEAALPKTLPVDGEQRPEDELALIAAALGAQIVEVDPRHKPKQIEETEVFGWYDAVPSPRLIFPADRPLQERVAVARAIAADMGVSV